MKLMKTSEVAAILGMSEFYIRAHDKDLGLVPIRTIGRQRRYRATNVLEALQRFEERFSVNEKEIPSV